MARIVITRQEAADIEQAGPWYRRIFETATARDAHRRCAYIRHCQLVRKKVNALGLPFSAVIYAEHIGKGNVALEVKTSYWEFSVARSPHSPDISTLSHNGG